MRPDAEFEAVQQLIRAGLNDCAVSRETSIPRGTIREWRHQGNRDKRDSRARPRPDGRRNADDCPICSDVLLDEATYTYLLGLYLGDGCLSEAPRRVFKLRIVLDNRYPAIIDECREAMARMRTLSRAAPGRVPKVGCTEVFSHWKHWKCLFPQHAAGRKHPRPIVLTCWQRTLAMKYRKCSCEDSFSPTVAGT